MQRYNFDRFIGRIVRDGLDIGAPQNWAVYSAVEVDAEITRLNAEIAQLRASMAQMAAELGRLRSASKDARGK